MVSMPLFHVGGSSYAQFGIHAGHPEHHDARGRRGIAGRAIMAGATRTFLVPAVLAKVSGNGSWTRSHCSTGCVPSSTGPRRYPPALLRQAPGTFPTPTSSRCTD